MSPLLYASDIELPRDPTEPMHAATKQYVDNGLAKKAELQHTHTTDDVSGLGSAAKCDTGTSEGNVPVINSAGKLDASLLPSITVSDTFTAGSEAEMLALQADQGDVCVRTDTNETYILTAADPTVIANWTKLLTPVDAVQSVNGKTDVVVLTADDIGAVSIDSLGEADGLAVLDDNGKVPVAQLLTQSTLSDDADSVPTNAAVFAHTQETNAHSATATPAADRIAMFGASGNLKNSEVGVRVYKNDADKLTPVLVQWAPTTDDQITLSFALPPATTDKYVVKVID